MKHLKADSKGRIFLGAKYAGKIFIEIEQDNAIVLEKATIIPERELWLQNNKEAKKSITKGIEDVKNKRTTKNAINLNKYEID